MARMRLRDDLVDPWALVDPPEPIGQHLDEDPAYEVFDVNPTLTVRQRARIGYTDDGDPLYRWVTVVEGLAALWEARDENDDLAGSTAVKATATILYDGDTKVTESAIVAVEGVGRFRVRSVEQVPTHLAFTLERMDG